MATSLELFFRSRLEELGSALVRRSLRESMSRAWPPNVGYIGRVLLSHRLAPEGYVSFAVSFRFFLTVWLVDPG